MDIQQCDPHSSRPRRSGLLGTFAALLAITLIGAPEARAEVDDWFTLGAGAQYSYINSQVAGTPDIGQAHYGLMSRAKILKFIGLEGVVQIDNDMATQSARIMSPRYQLGVMLNVIPTPWFNLYAVAGTGAHNAGDLINLNGKTTSLHAGPGLEIFVSDHMAIGGDFRLRMPGPYRLKDEVVEARSMDPLDEHLELDVWQVNVMVAWYL